MKRLETKRLVLRAIRSDDYENLYRMNSDPLIMQYVGDGSVRTREQMVGELEMVISHYVRKPGLGIFAVEAKADGQFLGAAGLVYYDNTPAIEIGYRFLKEHWNKGYATEASLALLSYGFDELGLLKIVASAHVDNLPSRRVMEKIGMRYIDDRLHYGCIQAYYELSRTAYPGHTDIL